MKKMTLISLAFLSTQFAFAGECVIAPKAAPQNNLFNKATQGKKGGLLKHHYKKSTHEVNNWQSCYELALSEAESRDLYQVFQFKLRKNRFGIAMNPVVVPYDEYSSDNSGVVLEQKELIQFVNWNYYVSEEDRLNPLHKKGSVSNYTRDYLETPRTGRHRYDEDGREF